MRRWICAAVCAVMLLGGSALAETVSVKRADGVGETVDMWEKKNGRKYLFLPAYMEGQKLAVSHDGLDELVLDDVPLASGDEKIIGKDSSLLMKWDGHERRLNVMQSSLPAIHLETESKSLHYIHFRKGNREKGKMTIITPEGGVDFQGNVKAIKGHGNATFAYEKKSYQVKLEEKASLLGMKAGKTYVLLANQHENSLLRNRMTFELAQAVGLPFTSDCRSVDLYIHGEYRGNYLLCSKVSISSGSVDITDSKKAIEKANADLIERDVVPEPYGRKEYGKNSRKGIRWPHEPDDVTGGYLFEMEYRSRYANEDSGVVTREGQPIVVKEPEQMTRAQGKYAAEFLNSFERAIFANDGIDPKTGRSYTEIADLDSLVKKYMIEEISCNFDANKSSQYFFKDSDSVNPLLYAGPVWDYDSAWGNFAKEGQMNLASPRGLPAAREGASYSWWPALVKQDDFAQAVRKTYRETFRPMLLGMIGAAPLPDGCALKTLDGYAKELEASAEMNFVRWNVLNHSTRAVKTGATYAENIEYLRRFIQKRVAYLDEVW